MDYVKDMPDGEKGINGDRDRYRDRVRVRVRNRDLDRDSYTDVGIET